jgi:hypothetical protein
MAKYLLPIVFVVLLALNAAAYTLLTMDLDGSTVATKRIMTQQERQQQR